MMPDEATRRDRIERRYRSLADRYGVSIEEMQAADMEWLQEEGYYEGREYDTLGAYLDARFRRPARAQRGEPEGGAGWMPPDAP